MKSVFAATFAAVLLCGSAMAQEDPPPSPDKLDDGVFTDFPDTAVAVRDALGTPK